MVKNVKVRLLVVFSILLMSCASPQVNECPPGTQALSDCPPVIAVDDETINRLYESRSWIPPKQLTIDPIKLSEDANVPVNFARAKVIGTTYDEAVKSLALKLWLIENARYTIDVMYYIFAHDPVGYAMLGSLCDAVKRGVDVRIMVDSLGSFHPTHDELRALETCADEAGFMHNDKGQITTKKARVQAVIFNAISKSQFNRRSHDKLLIVDGHSPEHAAVITGGRNISVDYYGINEDGTRDPTAFRDVEILLKSKTDGDTEHTVGGVAEIYYSLLFLHKGNRRLRPVPEHGAPGKIDTQGAQYQRQRQKAQESLAFIKSVPDIRKHLDDMPRYTGEGFHISEVRLAHQLNNLTSKDVTTRVFENVAGNPNSILYLIGKLTEKAHAEGHVRGTLRIVSPYLFSGLYRNKQGEVIYDGAKNLLKVLRDNPDMKLEVITNSVMTSDNIFTQAIIDMDMVPRMLLTPEMSETWQGSTEKGELNPQFVESEEWIKLINHPQVFIYQTGKLDSVLLGRGTTIYGKLHAKFILGEHLAFIGTSNFDYRSNLYNNEMGFIVNNPGIHQDLVDIFELLKATSYRWGTAEWLQMRKELMETDTKKSSPARKQRHIYKTIRALGIEYLI